MTRSWAGCSKRFSGGGASICARGSIYMCRELAELEKEMKEKHAAEHEALYEKLVWEKE